MDAKDLQYFKDVLNGMLDDILRKSEETIEDMTESGEVYADPADRATAESDRAFTLRLRDRERKLIKKIQKAITRIEDGDFGVCVECGDDISIPRLKARPMTTLCINCKSKQEEDEAVRGDQPLFRRAARPANAMEANFFRFLAVELGHTLLGRRIDKVFGPAPGVWTLTLQSAGEPLYLLFRPAKLAGLLFLSAAKPPNPKDAPAMAMWFRKRLRNRKIIGWAVDWPSLRLALELTPRHDPPCGSYLVLDVRNEMRLADSLEPGFGAQPDWPALEDVLEDPDIWRDYPHISPPLRKTLTGLPPDKAHRLYLNVAGGTAQTFHLPTHSDALQPPQAWPDSEGDESFGTAIEAANAFGQRTLFPLLDLEEERPEQTRLKRERKKIKRNLARLDEEEARLLALADEKIMAEALQTELYRFKEAKSLEAITVTHPERGAMTVALNPHLSPVENMALYFKRAAKAERGFPHIHRRRSELTDQLNQLERGVIQPPARTDESDIPPPQGPPPLPKRYTGLAVTVFRSSDGFTLVRGKNKRANHDMLSRAASPFDYWFHLADGPSSHVILKRDHPAQEVPERTLAEAARLCAIKSHSRDDGKAEVMYALVRDVRKVKGFAHGQVVVDKRLGTLRVDLDPDIETALSR